MGDLIKKLDGHIETIITLNNKRNNAEDISVPLLPEYKTLPSLASSTKNSREIENEINRLIMESVKAEIKTNTLDKAFDNFKTQYNKPYDYNPSASDLKIISDIADKLYENRIKNLANTITTEINYSVYKKQAEKMVHEPQYLKVKNAPSQPSKKPDTNAESLWLASFNPIADEVEKLFLTELEKINDPAAKQGIKNIEKTIQDYKLLQTTKIPEHDSNDERLMLTCARIAFLKLKASQQKDFLMNYNGMNDYQFYGTALMILQKIHLDRCFDNYTYHRVMEMHSDNGRLYNINDSDVNKLEEIFVHDFGLINTIQPGVENIAFDDIINTPAGVEKATSEDNKNQIPDRIAPDIIGIKKLFIATQNKKEETLPRTPISTNSQASSNSSSSNSPTSSSSSEDKDSLNLTLYNLSINSGKIKTHTDTNNNNVNPHESNKQKLSTPTTKPANK